jgi:ABC-type antimicrobial peptide transport system permease subunit
MNTSNLKDTLTTIASIMALLSGAIITIGTQGVVLPAWLNTAAIVLGALSVTIIGFLTGKLPSGAAKSEATVAEQNAGAEPK